MKNDTVTSKSTQALAPVTCQRTKHNNLRQDLNPEGLVHSPTIRQLTQQAIH